MNASSRAAASSTADAVVAAVRVDKWLWAARFFKTRRLAVEAIDKGHVQLGDERIKPSRPLRVGNTLTVHKEGAKWTFTVRALSERRLSAPLATALYEETTASLTERQALLEQRRAQPSPHFPGRPTKRDRRALEDFLSEA
ncbi:MAG: RNA-binding S4 domain-containing protein [Burkholderiales bacterium]|jgi:ribosome-associated heat shock protein Hsp15|nr:RNA-binding S4 domain-containing protein [Burkholderiales bacterium]